MILPALKRQIEIYETHLSNLEWHLKTNSDLLGDRKIVEQRIRDKKQSIYDLDSIYSSELARLENCKQNTY